MKEAREKKKGEGIERKQRYNNQKNILLKR